MKHRGQIALAGFQLGISSVPKRILSSLLRGFGERFWSIHPIQSLRRWALLEGRKKSNAWIRFLACPPAEQPRAVFIHGWEGMGRERLLMRVAGENSIARVNLRDASGGADLLRELLILLDQPTPTILHEKETAFIASDRRSQAAQLGHLLDKILRSKFHLQITESNSLFLDNGRLVPWFAEAANALSKSSPYCVFVRSRRRPVNYPEKWKIDDLRLRELPPSDMENLLGRLLNEASVIFTSEKLRRAVEELGGHPFSAYRFAGYAKNYGMDAALSNDAIMVQYRELLLADALEDFQLSLAAWKILFVVSRFRIVDIASLAEYTMLSVQEILPPLEQLIDSGMLTHSGDRYSVAPFVREPLQRHKSWQLDREWMNGVDERVARAGESFTDEGIGSSALLDNAIAANLRLGNRQSSPLANLVLGSHLFRIARDVYNSGNYKKALELYREALSLRSTLAPEAVSEALRIMGLCGVRLELDEVLASAISQLNALNLQTARRNSAFLRGFRERRQKNYSAALPHFEESLRYGEHPHTLREAAFCALKLGDLQQARNWASKAVQTAQTNAYFLDVMCRVVLAEFILTKARDKEVEFEGFLRRLERACSSTGDSFADLRALERAVAFRDVSTVRAIANKLERSGRYDDIVCAAGAAALIADDDISDVISRLEKDAYGSGGRKRTDFEALKCLQALRDDRIDVAVEWIRRGRTEWELEGVGITYEMARQKVLIRARAAIGAGQPMSRETMQYVQAQRR